MHSQTDRPRHLAPPEHRSTPVNTVLEDRQEHRTKSPRHRRWNLDGKEPPWCRETFEKYGEGRVSEFGYGLQLCSQIDRLKVDLCDEIGFEDQDDNGGKGSFMLFSAYPYYSTRYSIDNSCLN